jgi:hypothetical protein
MWLLSAGSALALSVRVDARAEPAEGCVRGTIAADGPVTWMDPLAALSEPAQDRQRIRAYPGSPERGSVRWTHATASDGSEQTNFEACLPRRYGPTGAIDGSLVSDTTWLPVPVEAGRAAIVDWNVVVSAPEDTTLVLNDALAASRAGKETQAHWRGRSDRVALAALPRATVTRTEGLAVVGRRAPTRHTLRWLATAIADAPSVGPAERAVVVVRIRDFERLVRPSRGVLFVSERAFRLTGAVAAYHVDAVRRGVAAAAAPLADAQQRAFVAAAMTTARPPRADASRLLRWFAWNPVIEAMLQDGTLPFYEDVFGVPVGGPQGPSEALDPRPPGASVAAQLDDLRGPGTAASAARLLLAGNDWESVLGALQVPESLVAGWQAPRVERQDYRAAEASAGDQVGTTGATLAPTILRDAPADAPAEVVMVRVDGRDEPWIAGPGPARLQLPGAQAVRVDPSGHVLQEDRGDDATPARWSVMGSGFVYGLSPTQRNTEASLDLAWRRTGGTRGLSFASLGHDPQDLVSLTVGHTWTVGPLVDRRSRAHRLTVQGGSALLDPAFHDTGCDAWELDCAAGWALGAAAAWSWDTRTERFAPLSGHRLSASLSSGVVPGDAAGAYGQVGFGGVAITALHPRAVVVTRVRTGGASGDIPHRLLALGGASDLRALPNGAFVGNLRAVTNAELRLVPLRNASLPALVGWVSELHISPGLEAAAGWRQATDTTAWALGATLGLHAALDVLGARPSYGGITLALPLAGSGTALGPGDPADAAPQFYFDLGHPF